MSAMAAIEKNIPIPEKFSVNRKYPFDEMEIGDSFVCENAHGITYAYTQGRRLGKKFVARRLEAGSKHWRIWRVA